MTAEASPVPSRWSAHRLPVLCVVLAMLLRAWHLDHMSIWQDEGLSLYRASGDLATMLGGHIPLGDLVTTDVHPPLYFLLLGGWFRLVGTTTWLAKVPSLLASLPTVTLVWVLARRLAGRRAASAAAVLAALSPAHLWYAQEIRSYTLGVSLSALGVYALVRALGIGANAAAAPGRSPTAAQAARPKRVRGARLRRAATGRAAWAWLAVAAAGALVWTHYLGFLVVAFEGLVTLAVVARRHAVRPLLAIGAVVLVTAPLVPFARYRLAMGAERDQHFVPLDVILADVVRGLGPGRTLAAPPLDAAEALAVHTVYMLFAAALVAGAVFAWRRRRAAALLLVGYLIVPVLALFAVSLVKPIYLGAQHLLLVSPALLVLLGTGLASPPGAAGRRIALGAGTVVLGAMLIADRNFYVDARLAKDDLRGLAAYVDARAVPGDVLAVSDPVLERSFERLVRRVPVIAVPRMTWRSVLDDRPPEAQLAPLLAEHDRVWFMTPLDDHRAWLATHAVRVDEEVFHGASIPVRVEAYERPPDDAAVARPDRTTPGVTPVGGADLGGLALRGWSVTPEVPASGGAARVRLWWEARASVPAYKVALRLLDASGADLADGDHEPFHGERPTSTWPRDAVTVEPHDLLVSPAAPPGTYRLAVSVYDPGAGTTFPPGEPLVLGEVEIARPSEPIDPQTVAARDRLRAAGSGVDVIGYDLASRRAAPGEVLDLAVWVRIADARAAERSLVLEVLDGAVVVRRASAGIAPIGAGPDDPGANVAGDIRRVRLADALPARSGAYGLRLVLVDRAGRARWWRLGPLPVRGLWLGQIVVAAPRRDFIARSIVRRLDVDVGEAVTLLGYDPPAHELTAGSAVTATLYWRARDPVPASYHVTVQLLPATADGRPSGPPVAQHDGAPAEGRRPTLGWEPGEVVTDRHVLEVPAGVAAGTYVLIAALYDPTAPGAPRPLVHQDGQVRDHVVLDRVTVRAAAPTPAAPEEKR